MFHMTSDFDSSLFLYEHRTPCNQIALAQLGLFALSILLTSHLWCNSFFSFSVAAMGYYSSLAPVVVAHIRQVYFYYCGQYFLFGLQALTFLLLCVGAATYDAASGWDWVRVLVGLLCVMAQAYSSVSGGGDTSLLSLIKICWVFC